MYKFIPQRKKLLVLIKVVKLHPCFHS